MNELENTTNTLSPSDGGPHFAASATIDTNCPGCSASVPRSAKFCGQCGARLWDPCPACTETNSVAERFCHGCGTDVPKLIATTLVEAEGKLAEADRLAEYGSLIEAIALLDSVKLPRHSRFAEVSALVPQRIEQYETQREQIVENLGGVLDTVKRLVEEVRFRDAKAEAEKIPPALRNAELGELFQMISTKVEEVTRLKKQLQAGLKEKNYAGLAAIAGHLLELDPHDTAVQKVHPQLQAWQAKADGRRATEYLLQAEKLLGQNAYRKAAAVLADVSENCGADLEPRYRAARERVWLASFVARSPYVTPLTLAAVDRLLKFQPADDKAKVLAKQLSDKWKKAPMTVSGVPAVWSKPPEQHLIVPNVGVCPLPPTLVKACAARKAAPHEFAVAYGLALQSAGSATINQNLMPAQAGWRDKFKLGGGRRHRGTGWGIQLEGNALTAVCLMPGDDPAAPPVVQEIISAPYDVTSESGPLPAHGTLPESVQKVMDSFFASRDLSRSAVTVSLAGPQTLGRFFELPVPSPAKFNQAIEYEARSRVPLPAEDVVFDHYAEDLTEGRRGDAIPKRWVTLSAASRNQIENRVESFAQVKCASLQVAPAPVAMLNTALSPGGVASDRAPTGSGLAIVEVGYRSTVISVATPSKFWFRGVHLGGASLVGALAKEFKIDRKSAMKFLRKPDAAPWMHLIHDALLPVYEELAMQIKRSLEQCQADTGESVDTLLLTGGYVQAMGLIRYLRIAE